MVSAEKTENASAPDTPLPSFVSQTVQPSSIALLPFPPMTMLPTLSTRHVPLSYTRLQTDSVPSGSISESLDSSPYAAFMEYHQMMMHQKISKVKAIFRHLSDPEINALMNECGHNEDDVILKLITQPAYLSEIHAKYPALSPSPAQLLAPRLAPDVQTAPSVSIPFVTPYPPPNRLIPPMIPATQITRPAETVKKKQSRMSGSRLALDDALKQAKDNPQSGFEGWSQARVRAYKMIDQNPNSYYYRFNAPGEEQRKGQWTDQERALFFARLSEVGANSQWGIFSMAIPGRVGYQCSNFYRLLIETNQIQDPNYVVDEKGKAHYLFDKRTSDGQVQKTFRTHVKHGSRRQADSIKKPKVSKASTIKRRKKDDDDDTDDFKDYKVSSKSAAPATRRRTRQAVAEEEEEAKTASTDRQI